MGKNILDDIGSAIGAGVNNIGNFFGTVGNDVNHSINQFFAPTQATPQPTQPTTAPIPVASAPTMVTPGGIPIAPAIQAQIQMQQQAQQQQDNNNQDNGNIFTNIGDAVANTGGSAVKSLVGGTAELYNELANRGDRQQAAKDTQDFLHSTGVDTLGNGTSVGADIGKTVGGMVGGIVPGLVGAPVNLAIDLGTNLGAANYDTSNIADLNTRNTVDQYLASQAATPRQTAIDAAETALGIVAPGSSKLTEGIANPLLKAGADVGINGAIGSDYGILETARDPNASLGDYVKGALTGFAGGGILTGVSKVPGMVKTAADNAAHDNLIQTNPTYQTHNTNANNLAQVIAAAKEAKADPAIIKTLTDQLAKTTQTMADMRTKAMQSGSLKLPSGEEDNQLAQQQAANYSSADQFKQELINQLWADNKKGKGVDIAQYDAGLPGIGSDTYRGFRNSNNSNFYRNFFEEYGYKPTKKEITNIVNEYYDGKENILSKEVPEGTRDVYDLIKERDDAQQAHDASATEPGQDIHTVKVNTINGRAYKSPRFNEAQQAAYDSPEYKAKNEAWHAVQLAKENYRAAQTEAKLYDKKINGLRGKGRLQEAVDQSDPRVHLNVLKAKNELDAIAQDHAAKRDAFNAKYPDANFDGKMRARQKAQVRITAKKEAAQAELDKEQEDYLNQPANEYKPRGKVKIVSPNEVKLTDQPVKEPAGNPAVESSPINDKTFQETFNTDKTPDEVAAERDSKSTTAVEDYNQATPKTAKQTEEAAQTAAFEHIRAGESFDKTVEAYRRANPDVSEEDAIKVVNGIMEQGANMADKEAVLARNPSYKRFDRASPPKNIHDVYSSVMGARHLFSDFYNHDLAAIDSKMSAGDRLALDDARNKPINQFMAEHEGQLDNPELVKQYLDLAKQATDDVHEYGRVNGADVGVYRQNRGAGLYTSLKDDPENIIEAPHYYDPTGKFGTSNSRYHDDYETLLNDSPDRVRTNTSFHEDVLQDLKKAYPTNTLHLYNELQQLEGKYGKDSVALGQPTAEAPVQLKGQKNIFGSREMANDWAKLNKTDTSTGLTKKVHNAVSTVTRAIIQATVYNPLIHGQNLAWQAFQAAGNIGKGNNGLAGVGRAFRAAQELHSDPVLMNRTLADYYIHGGHIDFSSGREPGWASKVTNGKVWGLGQANKTALYSIDKEFRLATYKAEVDAGTDPHLAVRKIDNFLGDDKQLGWATQNFGFFLKWAKTTGVSLYHVARVDRNSGAIQNLAIATGLWMALNYGYQQATGNKNAYQRAPGNLGIIKEVVNGIKGIQEGDNGRAASQIVTNRVNPLLKEGIQQATNYDWFTGNKIDNTNDASNRLGHAVNTLVSPANQGGKVASGSKSLPEVALNAGLGVYTPHAKGDVATTNPALSFLNTPGAKVAKGNDPTGYQEQQAHFSSIDQARNSLSTPARQAKFDELTASDTDPNTGKPIGLDEKDAMAHAADLAANPDVLEAIAKQKNLEGKLGGTAVDPLYSQLTPDQRKTYEQLQSMGYKNDDYNKIATDNASWLKPFETARAAYFKGVDFIGASPSQRVQPPQFSPQVEADMTKASSLSGAEKAQYIAANPNLQAAYDSIDKYTNDKRIAQGLTPFKSYPKADPETTANINNYMAMGKAGRSSWIKANPAAYNKMQDYFASTSEYQAANNWGADKYLGATPNQAALKSAYDLGKYDIAKVPLVGGGEGYALSPATANAQNYKTFTGNGGKSSGGLSNRGMKAALRISKMNNRRIVTVKRSPSPKRTKVMHVSTALAKPQKATLRIRSQKAII